MIDFFALKKEEAIVLYSLQNYLIKLDLNQEENLDKKVIKKLWLKKWQNAINNFLKAETEDEGAALIEDYASIINEIKEVNIPLYKRRMLIIELLTFYPYFPLEEKDSNLYKGLKLNKKARKEVCEDIAVEMELEKSEVDDIEALYKSSYNFYTEKMKNTMIKVVSVVGAGILFASGAWAFAPSVVPILTAAGLTGAAAINAGIAVLGGGAISADGVGVKDGSIILVCGGGILGCSSELGSGIAMKLLKESQEYTMVQSIKLDCTLKYVFILNEDSGIPKSSDEIAAAVVKEVEISKDSLLEMASALMGEFNTVKASGNKKDIKDKKAVLDEIKNSVMILEKFINRYQYSRI